MTNHLDLVSHSLAVFASNGKINSNSQNQSQNHESGRGRGRNNSNRGREGGRCNHNGGQQQFSSQATQNFSPQNSSQGFKHERTTCQICGKSGYRALNCYHRMDFVYQGKNPPQSLLPWLVHPMQPSPTIKTLGLLT